MTSCALLGSTHAKPEVAKLFLLWVWKHSNYLNPIRLWPQESIGEQHCQASLHNCHKSYDKYDIYDRSKQIPKPLHQKKLLQCFFPSLVPLGITPGSKGFRISFTSSPLSLFPSPPVSYNRVGSRLSERKLDWLVKVSTWSRLDGKFSKSFPRVLELLRNWRCHRQCILDSLLHMRARVCKCYSTWSFEVYQLGSS